MDIMKSMITKMRIAIYNGLMTLTYLRRIVVSVEWQNGILLARFSCDYSNDKDFAYKEILFYYCMSKLYKQTKYSIRTYNSSLFSYSNTVIIFFCEI